jgi:hypothetical protein
MWVTFEGNGLVKPKNNEAKTMRHYLVTVKTAVLQNLHLHTGQNPELSHPGPTN